MGNYEARLEREWERRDAEYSQAHKRGEHAEAVPDCTDCWVAAKEAAGRPVPVTRRDDLTIDSDPEHDLDGPDPTWQTDAEGYVRAPLSYENREGDPAFNGALDKW